MFGGGRESWPCGVYLVATEAWRKGRTSQHWNRERVNLGISPRWCSACSSLRCAFNIYKKRMLCSCLFICRWLSVGKNQFRNTAAHRNARVNINQAERRRDRPPTQPNCLFTIRMIGRDQVTITMPPVDCDQIDCSSSFFLFLFRVAFSCGNGSGGGRRRQVIVCYSGQISRYKRVIDRLAHKESHFPHIRRTTSFLNSIGT